MENIFWYNDGCLIFKGAVIPLLKQISRSTSQGMIFATGGTRVVNNLKIELQYEL
jgi:hypothetical protein